MGLVQVATTTVTSAVASVTLTGIDSDDVYMVALNNITLNTSGSGFYVRVTTSGTADSDSEYDPSSSEEEEKRHRLKVIKNDNKKAFKK